MEKLSKSLLIFMFDHLIIIGKFLKIGTAQTGMILFGLLLVAYSLIFILPNSFFFFSGSILVVCSFLLMLNIALVGGTFEIQIENHIYTNAKKASVIENPADQARFRNQKHFKTLGISEDADQSEIHLAYRKLAKMYHPDLNKNDPMAQDKFIQIKKAYDFLTE